MAVSHASRHHFLSTALVLAGLLAAWAVALHGLDRQSLWLDEGWTAWAIRPAQPLPAEPRALVRAVLAEAQATLSRVRADDVHPPLYYAGLMVWSWVAGDSEFALRLPSALAALVALAAVYAGGQAWFGWRGGLYALLLVCFSGLWYTYAREARMYGLWLALCALATVLAWRWRTRPTVSRAAIYGLVLALALYTHYLSLLLWLIHALFHVGWLMSAWRRLPWWRLILPFGLAIALCAPCISFALAQWHNHPGGPGALYQPVDLNTTAGFILVLTAGAWWLYLLPFVIWRAVRRPWPPRARPILGLTVLGLGVPTASLALLTSQGYALWQLRYLLIILPFMAWLMAGALSRAQSRRGHILTILLVLAIGYRHNSFYDQLWPPHSPWREFVAQTASARPADEPGLAAIPGTSPAAYYNHRYALTDGITIDFGWRLFEPAEVRALAGALAQNPRVWLAGQATNPAVWDALAGLLDGRGIVHSAGTQTLIGLGLGPEGRAPQFRFHPDYAFVGPLGQVIERADELCFDILLRADQHSMPAPHSLALSLTHAYSTVIAQRTIPLLPLFPEQVTTLEVCMNNLEQVALVPLHVRLSLLNAHGAPLPVVEGHNPDSLVYWGDFIVIGTVETQP